VEKYDFCVYIYIKEKGKERVFLSLAASQLTINPATIYIALQGYKISAKYRKSIIEYFSLLFIANDDSGGWLPIIRLRLYNSTYYLIA
jgi:hypothetical protein